MSSRLNLPLLRRELDRLLAEVEARHGQSLEVEADHYWQLESSETFDLSNTASPSVGQLSDDISELEQLPSRANADLVRLGTTSNTASAYWKRSLRTTCLADSDPPTDASKFRLPLVERHASGVVGIGVRFTPVAASAKVAGCRWSVPSWPASAQ